MNSITPTRDRALQAYDTVAPYMTAVGLHIPNDADLTQLIPLLREAITIAGSATQWAKADYALLLRNQTYDEVRKRNPDATRLDYAHAWRPTLGELANLWGIDTNTLTQYITAAINWPIENRVPTLTMEHHRQIPSYMGTPDERQEIAETIADEFPDGIPTVKEFIAKLNELRHIMTGTDPDPYHAPESIINLDLPVSHGWEANERRCSVPVDGGWIVVELARLPNGRWALTYRKETEICS